MCVRIGEDMREYYVDGMCVSVYGCVKKMDVQVMYVHEQKEKKEKKGGSEWPLDIAACRSRGARRKRGVKERKKNQVEYQKRHWCSLSLPSSPPSFSPSFTPTQHSFTFPNKMVLIINIIIIL